MNKKGLLITCLCLIVSGCSKFIEGGETIPPTVSGIIARTANIPSGLDITEETAESIVFTGNDILWFNESTKEIRFKDNLSMQAAFSNVQALKFYIDDEYLFSATYVNSLSSQIIQGLVLYYNIIENKYFLQNGYPPDRADALFNSNGPPASDVLNPMGNESDEEMQNITSEWIRFMNQLKKEGKRTG